MHAHRYLKEASFDYAFLLDQLGLKDAPNRNAPAAQAEVVLKK